MGRGYKSLRHLGHMTKPIYGKNSSKIFSGTSGLISMKLGLLHLGLQPITVLANDDPGLTLTYFTARSNFETSFSNQSRTNGPINAHLTIAQV